MVDSNVYNFLFIFIYIISSSGIIAVKIVGISLSGRQWNPLQGLVSGWVAAPAVDVQSDSGSAVSVAVVTDEIHAWLCGNWRCPQTPALSPLSFPHTPECCNSKPPVALVCSCNFPICRVDIATHSRVLSTQAWYNFILVLMVNLVLSQTLQSSCQCCCCCFANSFFSSVSRESWWRCWSLQSWTKVLGTVLQYSYFSVISRFPLKTVHHFGNFLAVLPPFTLAIQSWNSKKILDTRPTLFVGVRGGVGLVWIGKRPTNAKVSQDFCPWL